MGLTFQRKDQTSIFCPQPMTTKHQYSTKTRFYGTFLAFSLMAIGTWIIFSAH